MTAQVLWLEKEVHSHAACGLLLYEDSIVLSEDTCYIDNSVILWRKFPQPGERSLYTYLAYRLDDDGLVSR